MIKRIPDGGDGYYCWWGASECFSEEVEGDLSWDLREEKTVVMKKCGSKAEGLASVQAHSASSLFFFLSDQL